MGGGGGDPRLAAAVAVALALLAGSSLAAKRLSINVGYLPSVKGPSRDRQGLAISGALLLALEEINNSTEILPDVEIKFEWNDTKCDVITATRALTDMSCSGVVAFFGPEGHCETEAIVAQSRNLPMISYKCSDSQTSTLSNFARLEPQEVQVANSVISLLKYYRWQKFSILYEQAWDSCVLSLENLAKRQNMTVNHQRTVTDSHKCCEERWTCCAPGFWYQYIQDTKNRTRIYVYLGSTSGLIEMMGAMESLQLFVKGEYMVIFVDMMTYSPKEALKYIINTAERGGERDEQAMAGAPPAPCLKPTPEFRRRAQSLFVVVSSEPTGNYAEFTDKVRLYNSRPPFEFSVPAVLGNRNKYVSIYAAYLYDSVKLYARALNSLIIEEVGNGQLTYEQLMNIVTNGTRIVAKMIASTPYKSISGMTIRLDDKADSEGNFSVLAFKNVNYSNEFYNCSFSMVPIGHFQQSSREYPEFKPNSRVPVDWPDNLKPEDEPSCGFDNEKCPKDESQITSLVVAGTLAVTLFCALVVTVSIYRKWKIEQEIEGLLWKIDHSEISGYMGSGLVWSPSKLSLASGMSCDSRCCPQIFATTAQYRGNLVRIKELKFSKKKDISREVMKEMRLLRELRHDHLNSLFGAVVEPLRVLLVTEYCAKGSLYDIIENEDIKLDKMFISSLVHDLIKAMNFIHSSPLIFHGNLKSSNCVVTSRWLLQVADFGLHELRYSAENEFIGEHQYYRGLLWKSPELLRQLEDPNGTVGGTQKGDVYAFGIILYEIIGRRGPFGLTTIEPKDIVERVKRRGDSKEPFRPDISLIEPLTEEYVTSCIKDCWAEEPNARPDFTTIRHRLKKLKSGRSRNIMDQMMDMMEKYANNLEDLVNERTRLLFEEKQKTEDLLHRMLPKSVARRLTTGEGVEPESFDSVTIYFSDIVGFTAMSAESTPLQVVNFLNDLYTVFDRIIRGYDVYKVETIGDAYMVVSGLPIRNNDRHVGEIASMALELLHAAKNHKISHRPSETLKLRIGIHTGAVVAGVVGLTMPRYCLFGDTVNTASRMESTGEPLKIHISPSCKEALDKVGGYVVEARGAIHIKGKGEVVTYWLLDATERAVQKRPIEGEDLRPLFRRPKQSPRLADSRHASLSGGVAGSVLRQRLCGSRTSLISARASPSDQRPRQLNRHALSSIASSAVWSSQGCEVDAGGGGGVELRAAHSLDVLARAPRPTRPRRPTAHSLDIPPLSTLAHRHAAFNGTIIGIVTEWDPPRLRPPDPADQANTDNPAAPELSPLLRKSSLHNNKPDQKKKPTDGRYLRLYKKWHSLENVEYVKPETAATSRKMPRLALRSWLLGIFGGGAGAGGVRGSCGSLRRPAPLLDTESAV